MFGIGFPELLMILVIALMVIGPKKLPDIAKALGRAMGEFKRATDEFKHSINEETRAAEIREQILKGGKIYPPEANAPRDTPPEETEVGGVNPPPATLGPVATAEKDEPAKPAAVDDETEETKRD